MKLPKKLKIAGRTFDVEYFDFDKSVRGNNMDGNCAHNKQHIQIDSTNHRQHQESTLLHEIIHLVSNSMNMDLKEEQVAQLETGLYQVLNDNGFLKEK
jgi:Zn-dependent peptidase ImmA (M78 family)